MPRASHCSSPSSRPASGTVVSSVTLMKSCLSTMHRDWSLHCRNQTMNEDDDTARCVAQSELLLRSGFDNGRYLDADACVQQQRHCGHANDHRSGDSTGRCIRINLATRRSPLRAPMVQAWQSPANFVLTVNPVNDAPVTVADSYTVHSSER